MTERRSGEADRRRPTPNSSDLFVPAKLGFLGYGTVGYATSYSFDERSNHRDQILHYDSNPKKANATFERTVEDSDYIFVCLPTPMEEDESGTNNDLIDETIEKVAPMVRGSERIVVIKSTVVPGTTQGYINQYPDVHFAFNPEFLRQESSTQDALNPDRIVIGANNDYVHTRMMDLYIRHFPDVNIHQSDTSSAELAKLAGNTFLAMKVGFSNMLHDLCEKQGFSHEEVVRLMMLDKRIGDSHWKITTKRGWGGLCFPKDYNALRGEMRKAGVNEAALSVMDKIWEYNKYIRPDKDWLHIPGAIASKLTSRG
jgi:UDPglucose 6-dehydrogenase